MENELKNKDILRRGRKGKHVGFALFLILFGAVYLCLNTGVIPEIYKPILISWQMLLIVIGLWTLVIKRHYVPGIIVTGIGLVFLYPRVSLLFPEYFMNFDLDLHTYWPVILIAIGVVLVLGWMFPQKKKGCKWEQTLSEGNTEWEGKGHTNMNNADVVDKNVIFGSSEQIVLSSDFRGGDGNVMFGELIIDLRRAKLAGGAHKLELNAMFGSAILYLPSDWNVELRSSSFLASVEDKRYQSTPVENSASLLVIKASAMFGSVEIRN